MARLVTAKWSSTRKWLVLQDTSSSTSMQELPKEKQSRNIQWACIYPRLHVMVADQSGILGTVFFTSLPPLQELAVLVNEQENASNCRTHLVWSGSQLVIWYGVLLLFTWFKNFLNYELWLLAYPNYGLIAPRRTLKHTVVDSSNFTDHQGPILLFGLYIVSLEQWGDTTRGHFLKPRKLAIFAFRPSPTTFATTLIS
jgi:hypothetical protein